MHYYDEDNGKLVFCTINESEVERPIRVHDAWIKFFPWALAVDHQDPKGRCVARSRFFSWDLPKMLQFSAPWRDESRTKKHRSETPKVFSVRKADGSTKFEASSFYSENDM